MLKISVMVIVFIFPNMVTFSKVLEGNSDVKSIKAFQAVIKVLKDCKQGTSNHFSR